MRFLHHYFIACRLVFIKLKKPLLLLVSMFVSNQPLLAMIMPRNHYNPTYNSRNGKRTHVNYKEIEEQAAKREKVTHSFPKS